MNSTVMDNDSPIVILISSIMLLLIRMISAKILRDLIESMISKYFTIVTYELWPPLSKKKLHSNQKIDIFLACHPNKTIRNRG